MLPLASCVRFPDQSILLKARHSVFVCACLSAQLSCVLYVGAPCPAKQHVHDFSRAGCSLFAFVQLEDTTEFFRTNLKAGGVLDVVECYPCAYPLLASLLHCADIKATFETGLQDPNENTVMTCSSAEYSFTLTCASPSPSAAVHEELSLQPVITCSQPPHLHVGRHRRLAGTGEVVLHKRRDKRAGSHRGHVERTVDGEPCIW